MSFLGDAWGAMKYVNPVVYYGTNEAVKGAKWAGGKLGLGGGGGGGDGATAFDPNAQQATLAGQMGYAPGQMVDQQRAAPMIGASYGGGSMLTGGAPSMGYGGGLGNMGTTMQANGITDPATIAALSQPGALDGLKDMGWLGDYATKQRTEWEAANPEAAQAQRDAAANASQNQALSEGSAFYDTSRSTQRQNELSGYVGSMQGRQIVNDIAGPAASQYEGDQRALINHLSNPNQPSVAQLQMQQGLQDATASQFAMANSRPGALGQRQAMMNSAALGQRQINASGQLRAQEDQQRQGLLSQSLSNFRGQDQQQADLALRTGTTNNANRIQTASMNDANTQWGMGKAMDLDTQDRASKQGYWQMQRNYAPQANKLASDQANRAQERQDSQDAYYAKLMMMAATGA